jgi:hypothetical protein
MIIEKNSHHATGNAATIVVSESAKRQIAANATESKAHSASSNLGPSFFDGFPDGPAGPNR